MAMQEVAEFACTCERYVGTQSGGMDQAISIMGMNGVAKLINFDPVRTSFVQSICQQFCLLCLVWRLFHCLYHPNASCARRFYGRRCGQKTSSCQRRRCLWSQTHSPSPQRQ
jgi:galactokinase